MKVLDKFLEVSDPYNLTSALTSGLNGDRKGVVKNLAMGIGGS